MRLNISKNKKIVYSVLIVIAILLLSYTLPTLARFKNRGISSSNVWSGMVATKYKSGTGTQSNPYIISNGDELAFFSSQLENNNYEGKYFKITNNILLNEGEFKYENGKILYVIGNNTYYVDNNKYYDNPDFTGEEVGTINIMPSLNGFNGVLDADYHVIYGYYSTEPLFTDLNGDISSLYIENAFINSNSSTAIFADTITSSDITNVVVDGTVLSSTYVNNEPIVVTDVLSDYSELNEIILGGIAVYIEDATLINCINKANIYGGFIAGGLVGYTVDSSIVNAYSTGNITSNISSTIGVVNGTEIIDNLYNTGVINGGLVGYVIDAELNISNSFVATDNYLVLDIVNSSVTSTDNYYITQGKGDNISSTLATLNNLKDKNYLTNYGEFVSETDLETNPLNVWIFNDDMYPVLYIDDVINTYNELYVNTYVWNSYSPILDKYVFTNNLIIMISDVDNVHINDKYYYISDSTTPLTKTELESVEWTQYSNAITISDEGIYVVYVKLVDNNNTSYINSDILILDNSESDVSITMDNNTWQDITSGDMYLDHSFNLTISAYDSLSGVKSIEYYLGNSRVNDLTEIEWVSYSDTINVTNTGSYILYAKVVDNCDLISYASTPLIIYEGYTVSNLKPIGFNEGSTITKQSSVMFDISYSDSRQLSITHNLVSTINLPAGTKITMLDKSNNRVYEYVLSNSVNTVALSLFKEIGKATDTYYVEGTRTNESFTFIVDFSNCSISTDYSNVNIYLEGINNSNVIRPTIQKIGFNVLSSSSVELTHTISTTYSGSITYNSDSITNIPISTNISLNGAYDTKYSDKRVGLAINVVDSNNNVLNKDYLKNIIFKIGDNKYAPDSDNTIRINLNTNTSNNLNLSVTTYEGTSTLSAGTYYIKIYGYASYDGIYYSNLTNSITVPLVVAQPQENTNYNYSFNVSINSQNRIINKGDTENFNFIVYQQGLANPNIKVSMYRKNQLTAYNQDYTLIDMQNYTQSTLDEYIESVYYVSRSAISGNNTFNYSLNTTNLDKTCYKFVFDLYDGNVKVESISKYIIIR